MILTRFHKNKKGMTLVEMVVAIAVTAILAICLSMVMSPVMSTYNINKARAELANYGDKVLNNIAYDLRGARNIMLSSDAWSLPPYNLWGKVATIDIMDGYCLSEEYLDADGKSIKGKGAIMTRSYVITDWSLNRRILYPAQFQHSFVPDGDMTTFIVDNRVKMSDMDWKMTSDNTCIQYSYKNPMSTTNNIVVDGADGFYVLVKANPDDIDPETKKAIGNVLDIVLRLKKGKVTYTAKKSIICEDLVINHLACQKATIEYKGGGLNSKDPAIISTNDTLGKKGCNPYRSIWFGKGVHQ